MPDLEVLRDLTPQFPPPDLAALAAVVRRRRRRAALAAGVGALAAVVVVATLAGGMPGNDRSMDPVDDPTDGRTDGRTVDDLAWAPERIRAEGATNGGLQERDSGVGARIWAVCERANCDYLTTGDNYDHRVVHSALEVSVDGYRTSALFDLHGGPDEFPAFNLQPFDDDSVFVQDRTRQGGTRERYRLLNADGTTTDLTMLPSTAPAAPGPDVVRTSAFWPARLARVDDAAGTIQQLDLPTQVDWWAEAAADQLLWGVAEGCAVYWQQPGGDFAHRDLDCRSESDLMLYSEAPFAAWFTAKRMAALELGGSKGLPVALHVSLDRGATWRRIPVTEDTMDEVLSQQR